VIWTVQGSIPGIDSDFYFLQNVHTGFGNIVTTYLGDICYFPPELIYEADNSHLSTAKDKNE